MNKLTNIPCKDCICLSMCRHKLFYNMLGSCELLHLYDSHILDYYTRDVDKLLAIQDTLKPSTWEYTLLYPDRPYGKWVVTSIGINTLGR